MKYDVFISYSRKDYVDEQGDIVEGSPVKEIIHFLEENQITYWFDKEGIYSGREFVEVIADAIVDSKMMIFVSSVHSNESIYTTGEIFEALENERLIIPVKIDESQYNPKFKLLLRPLDYIDYSKTDAFADLLRAIQKEKEVIYLKEEEEKRKRKELEWKKNRDAVKNEVSECANEVQKLMKTRQLLLTGIYKKLRSIDVMNKECPVCKAKCELETEYCQTCGWYFPTLSNIDGLNVQIEKSALAMARTKWDNAVSISEENFSIAELKNENVELKRNNEKLRLKVDNCIKREVSKTEQIESLENTIKSLKEQVSRNVSSDTFKSCFAKHNIITAVLLCLAIVGLCLLGLIFYGMSIDKFNECYVCMIFLFFMSYTNYLLLKFKKMIWGIAPIISYLIGWSYPYAENLGTWTFSLCLIDLGFFAMLFFLKKNGKNSYYYMRKL